MAAIIDISFLDTERFLFLFLAGRDFLIATTGIVTGKSLIEGIASSTNGPRAKDAGL